MYQSVTTVSAVGFNEVQHLDTSGRAFTTVFILMGSGLMFYTAPVLVETVVAGEERDAGPALVRTKGAAHGVARH
jgi:hypothetical protein